MKKPETRRVKRIRNLIKSVWPRSKFFKIHGNEYQESGIPDLIGCVEGRFVAFEVKEPGKEPEAIQHVRLMEIKAAGGIVGTVIKVNDAINIIQKGLK